MFTQEMILHVEMLGLLFFIRDPIEINKMKLTLSTYVFYDHEHGLKIGPLRSVSQSAAGYDFGMKMHLST